MVVESQMRWRFSNDLLHFRASCFSLQDAVLTAVILFSLCGNSYKGEIFQEEYIHQKCFLYKKRILEISCRYNMLWGESEVAQSCPTLCDPMECSLSGSSVYGIFQARVLEWGAISFSRWVNSKPWKLNRRVTHIELKWELSYQPEYTHLHIKIFATE